MESQTNFGQEQRKSITSGDNFGTSASTRLFLTILAKILLTNLTLSNHSFWETFAEFSAKFLVANFLL